MANKPQQIAVRVEPIPGSHIINIYVPARALPKEDSHGAANFISQGLDETLENLGDAGWRQLPIILGQPGGEQYLFFRMADWEDGEPREEDEDDFDDFDDFDDLLMVVKS